MAKNEVQIVVTADDKTKSGFASVDKSTSSLGDKFKKLGAVAAVGFAAAGVAAVAFGKEAISEASDLNETINKTKVIFGDNAKSVLDWSKDSATAFGLSRNEALGYASDLGNMFDQLGFNADQTERLSESTVKFAADLGSFHNLDTGDVLDRINAAMRGEYDSLQQLIPNINAARVEQKAMAMTGKDNADALTQQEKAAATLAIIHKDGAKAAGDFERTSGSLANQQKILSAQIDNVQAKVGKLLLPILVRLAGWITGSVIPAIEQFADWFTKRAVPAIEDTAAAVRRKLGPAFEVIRDAVRKTIEFIQEKWPEFRRTVKKGLDQIEEDTGEYSDNTTDRWDKWRDQIKGISRNLFGFLGGYLKQKLHEQQGIWNIFFGAINGDWKQFKTGVIQLAKSIVEGILNPFKLLFQILRSILSGFVNWFVGKLREAGVKTRDAMGDIRRWTTEAFQDMFSNARRIWGALASLISAAVGRIRSAVSRLSGPVRSAFGSLKSVIDSVRGAVESLSSAIRNIPTPNLPDLPSFNVPGFAHGGITSAAAGGPRSRMTLVGEHGPELVDLAPGSYVHPAGTTQRMLAGAGGGGAVVLEIHSGGSRLDDLLVEVLRKSIRVKGGNVQAVLGR